MVQIVLHFDVEIPHMDSIHHRVMSLYTQGHFQERALFKEFPHANRGTESTGCRSSGCMKLVNDTHGIDVIYR